MREIAYDRNAAVTYARKWALSRNPAYYDFQDIGGALAHVKRAVAFTKEGIQ